YAVELAEGEKRALEVAAGGEIEAAIVVPGSGLASLAQALRDKIPRTIVLGEPADAHVRRGLLGGADEFVLQNLDEQKLLAQISAVAASPQNAGDEAGAPPDIVGIKLQVRPCGNTQGVDPIASSPRGADLIDLAIHFASSTFQVGATV